MAFSRERAQRADRKGRIYWAGLLSVSSSMLGLHPSLAAPGRHMYGLKGPKHLLGMTI